MSNQISGIKYASPAFLRVIANCVTMPLYIKEHNWPKLYETSEALFHKDLAALKLKKMLPFENQGNQIKDYISTNLPHVAHFYLASKGYPFAIDMSFLNTTIERNRRILPAFALLDANGAPTFGMSYSRNHIVIAPFDMHYTVHEFYPEAIAKMQANSVGSNTIVFKNSASPPDWARKIIHEATESRLFRRIYIAIDHTEQEWETDKDLFPSHDLSKFERIYRGRLNNGRYTRKSPVRNGEFKDPLIIGEHHFSFNRRPFGTHSTKVFSLLAVYNSTELEDWVVQNQTVR